MSKGFTLIELLIVIGILAILMGAMVIAVNPMRQFSQAKDAQRWAHMNSILNAAYQNVVENGSFTCAAGNLPTTATTMKSGVGGYDICACLVPTYLASMPFDPSTGNYTDCTDYDTGYTVLQNSTTTRVTVAAPSAELQTISMTR